MQKTVVIIHTSGVSIQDLNDLFKEIVPEATVRNIMDDSLLAEVMREGHATPGVAERMSAYIKAAESLGADLIFNQCSSVAETVDPMRDKVRCPILKVDQAMAEKAVSLGSTIAVVATVASTCGPSVRLVESAARAAGKEVRVFPVLVDGALALLMQGNRAEHNKLVLAAVEKAQQEADVIVLAQGSMVALLPELAHITKPVLASPRLGVERARRELGLK